jgi:hypothetical protein
MKTLQCLCAVFALSVLSASALGALAEERRLPAFGRDTVLVWKSEVEEFNADFVVRIAEFAPDRYLEWEDEKTQGTVFMPNSDIVSAKDFVNATFFKSGGDVRGKAATTLWLSQRIFRELKEKGKVKCDLDSVAAVLKYLGTGEMSVEVNRSQMNLPVIKVADDRGGERWFLDDEENPLLLKHTVRKFTQTLTSITTDRANTLRWIKGKKLSRLPQ